MTHIGVLAPVAGGFYFGDVLLGVLEEVAGAGGRVTLIQTRDAGETGDELAPPSRMGDPIGHTHIDGFITITESGIAPMVEPLLAAAKPVVLVSNDLGTTPSVMTDNRTGVRSAVAHLIGHGHTNIGFVGNTGQADMRERHDAYRDAMEEHGLRVDPRFVVPTVDHVESGGAQAATVVRAAMPELTAVVVATDRVALGLMQALTADGVTLPDDLAIVGFDDIPDGWHSTPPLSTVNQRVRGQGALAARLLMGELAGEPAPRRRHRTPSTFIPRRSCGCAGGAGAMPAGARGAESAGVVTPEGVAEGRAMVEALAAHLTDLTDLTPSAPTGAEPAAGPPVDLLADRDALDRVIESTLTRLFPTAPAPETVERFTHTVTAGCLEWSSTLERSGSPGADVVAYVMARTTVQLVQLEVNAENTRAQRLTRSLDEQYNVGMALLAQADTDPRDLSWLRNLSVRMACLGLWEGDPGESRLLLTEPYDPGGRLTAPVGTHVPVEDFPPRAIIDQVDATADEVIFVVPVRGAFGDHGLLCLVGVVDSLLNTGRAMFNHWAALLGAALKQWNLGVDVRRNEERYALVTAATEDGLWDWDLEAQACYYSERLQTMLGIDEDRLVAPGPRNPGRTSAPELHPWTVAIHPEDHPALVAAMTEATVHLVPFEVEHRIRWPDGEYRWALCRALPVGEPGGRARRIVGSLADIHPRKELEEQLRQGALYDAVTGLPNRRLFLERLTWAVDQHQREDGVTFAVVFLDLDGFKLVNDSLGHLMGDELLRVIGDRLRDGLRAVDTAARFGGDEFAVLLYGLQDDAVLTIVERIQEKIALPVQLAGQEVSVTASIGVASSGTNYTDAEDVLRDADIAMYNAKETERGTASVFDPAMHTRATGRLQAQTELRRALLENQFTVHYQPMVRLDGSPLAEFEALVRWEHPDRGILLPGEFLPVMAETGTIVTLGQWIVDAVCRQIAEWRTAYDGSATVSVNLSHREFWSEQLLSTVTAALDRHGIPAECLVLEITESVIMADPRAAQEIMVALRDLGVRLHIDDFGTGQSSLNALRALPVDALKLDQSFVQALGVDRQTTELVRIIVEMGKAFGMDVVAEGVETVEQAVHLRGMGCETVQGWLYARALPGSEAMGLLGTRFDSVQDSDENSVEEPIENPVEEPAESSIEVSWGR